MPQLGDGGVVAGASLVDPPDIVGVFLAILSAWATATLHLSSAPMSCSSISSSESALLLAPMGERRGERLKHGLGVLVASAEVLTSLPFDILQKKRLLRIYSFCPR